MEFKKEEETLKHLKYSLKQLRNLEFLYLNLMQNNIGENENNLVIISSGV